MDIFYKANGKCFQYRVGALIVHNNKLLLATNGNLDFYFTIGGRVKFGESSIQAIIREIQEELNIHLDIDKLAFVSENFYVYNPDGSSTHELGIYYYTKDSDILDSIHTIFFEGNQSNILQWIPLDNIKEYKIFPEQIVDIILDNYKKNSCCRTE